MDRIHHLDDGTLANVNMRFKSQIYHYISLSDAELNKSAESKWNKLSTAKPYSKKSSFVFNRLRIDAFRLKFFKALSSQRYLELCSRLPRFLRTELSHHIFCLSTIYHPKGKGAL